MNWTEINKNVWVWEMGENKYRVMIAEWDENREDFLLKDKIIDISTLSEEEIEETALYSYPSLEDMKQIEKNWKQIIAAKYVLYDDTSWLLSSKQPEVILQHVKNQYGLVTKFQNLQRTSLFQEVYRTYKEEILYGTLSEEDLKDEEMEEEVKKAFVSYLKWEVSESYCRDDIFETEKLLTEHGYLELYK